MSRARRAGPVALTLALVLVPLVVSLTAAARRPGSAVTAVPEAVGCLATIEQWEMPHPGLFHLVARGGERFRIRDMQVAPSHLISATIDPIPPDAPAEVDPLCRDVLKAIVEQVGAERFPAPLRLDDAPWVGYRLAELLPLDARLKQELLELEDASRRLARLRALLEQHGLNRPGTPD